MQFKKYFFSFIGWASVGLAFLGVILPIMPTVPFLLVAVWAFSKSSPELAERIRNHKTFGPMIRDWQDGGVIPTKAKVAAIVMMACSGSFLWFYSPAPRWLAATIVLGMFAVAAFVLSRPSRRP
jgi:uncharacterized protein